MTKTLVTIMAAGIFFLCGAITENIFLKNSFSDFKDRLEILYEKCDAEAATLSDATSTQKFWHTQKNYLHTVIPHNEIKEIDLWLAEAVRLIDQNNYKEAQQKIEVLLDLSAQIPSSYKLKFRNIF